MKTSRRELFEVIDKPALIPLPPARYITRSGQMQSSY